MDALRTGFYTPVNSTVKTTMQHLHDHFDTHILTALHDLADHLTISS